MRTEANATLNCSMLEIFNSCAHREERDSDAPLRLNCSQLSCRSGGVVLFNLLFHHPLLLCCFFSSLICFFFFFLIIISTLATPSTASVLCAQHKARDLYCVCIKPSLLVFNIKSSCFNFCYFVFLLSCLAVHLSI